MRNRFKIGTQKYRVFETLSDMQWHCTKCDLDAAQAATFRDMKLQGVKFDTDEKGHEYKYIDCSNCKTSRVHRKLL